MSFTSQIINILAGYDVIKKERQLNQSLSEKDKVISKLQGEHVRLAYKYENCNTQLKQKESECAVYVEKNSTLEAELEQIHKQFLDLENRFQDFQAKLSQKEDENRELDNKLQDAVSEKERLQAQNVEYEDKNNHLLSSNKQLNKEVSCLNNQVKALAKSISLKENEVSDLSQKNNSLSESYCVLQKNLQTASDEIQEIKLINKTLELDCKKYIENNNQLQTRNKELQEQLDEVNLKSEEYINQNCSEEEIKNLEKQIQKNEEEISSLNRTLTIKEDDIKRIKEENKHLIQAIEDERNKIISLSTKVSKYNNLNNILYEENKQLKNRVSILETKLQNENISEKKYSNQAESFINDSLEGMPQNQENNIQNSIDSTHTNDKPIKTLSPKTSKSVISKEQEALQLSDGNIVDFPEIINDATDTTVRSIRYVYNDKGEIVNADLFFQKSSAEEISHVSRMLSEADIKNGKYWTCGICRSRVKIAHRRYRNDKESLFFIHAQKNVNCPWTISANKSKDYYTEGIDIEELTEDEIETELNSDSKVIYRNLKLKIVSLLNSEKSKAMGVAEVCIDKIIRSNSPYMKWRRPDISFNFKDRKVVIELQNNNVDLDTIVDKDIFYRLNNIQVIWVFGNGEESRYDYMKLFNYKNTLFANHRNVFVLDKQAIEESTLRDELLLKCNWLDENNMWKFTIENSSTNGILILLNELTFDDEFCKPYYFDANEPYFKKYPEARTEYMDTLISREGLKKSIEEKWVNNSLYQDALTEMRKSGSYAEISKYGDLWGFRFNTKSLINPIFTCEPKLQDNKFYKVTFNHKLGIVDKFGMKIVDWDNDFDYDDIYYDDINNCIIYIKDYKAGVADKLGNEIIPAIYNSIEPWSNGIFKVQKDNRFGLVDLNNNIIADIKYNEIGKLETGRAKVTITHPVQSWRQLENYIDNKGKLVSKYSNLNDDYFLVQEFGLFGVSDKQTNIKVPCIYDEIKLWVDDLVRVKSNDKWGVIKVSDNSICIPIKFESIGNYIHGIANVTYVGIKSCINIKGEEVVEKRIQLQNTLVKTLKAGKWGIEDKNGNEIVTHIYDEIGSFRRRLIGIINNRIVKLDTYYDYPIPMMGKLENEENNKYIIAVAGLKCYMSVNQLHSFGYSKNDLFDKNNMCDKLGFMNMNFHTGSYAIRYLDEKNLTKMLSFGDRNSNFALNEVVEGYIARIKRKINKSGEKRIVNVTVKFPNHHMTLVSVYDFANSNKDIHNYKLNDSIKLKKIGFNDSLDRTVWEIL